VPGKTLPSTAVPPRGNANVTRAQAEPGIAKKLHFTGRGLAALDLMEKDIIAVIEQQKSSMEDGDELVLILDQPDLLLAATGPSMGIGATEMAEWVTGLQQVRSHIRRGIARQPSVTSYITDTRQHAYATVLTLATDAPLIHNASVSAGQLATPIETEHAAFAIGLAHRARSVMQLRTLETGAAKDVSGVLRISRGGGWSAGDEESLEEKEVLYFIQRDGGVSVFGRGES
jgi:elongator complex protein 6